MAASLLNTELGAPQQAPDSIRKLVPAGVAGAFYPPNPAALTSMMDGMLSRVAIPAIGDQIFAVVAPHAGYLYSGPVAAYTYAALKGRKYARVVVIAPSHYEAFDFTSLYDGDGYVTPLGIVVVDRVFARELANMASSIHVSERGHKPTRQGAEHAIEVQLPWLQHVLGSFMLVPIVMGDQSYGSSRALGLALAKLIQCEGRHDEANPQGETDTLVVASSDLSHYHTYDEGKKIDHKTLNALEAWDYLSMSQNFESRVWEACGGAPIVAAMIAAERMGAHSARVLHYANSGDVTGDHARVVGYSAGVFVKAPGGKAIESSISLSEEEKRTLLAVAHQSVERAVRDGKLYEPAATGDEALDQERGAFVTLKEAGKLRGCVGYRSAVKPLYSTISETAALAAVCDPRFPPVTGDELPRLEYEISVLSTMKQVRDVNQIEVGRDGLLIKNRDREGLLLPQVAVEQRWNRTMFLQQSCIKGGMDPDCWKLEETDIFRFTALVFHEQGPLGSK